MNRYFNTTGVCVPEYHYMVNIDNKIDKIIKLIDRNSYFVINRPRQYGKTTTLNELRKRLSKKYLVISTSFEGIGDIAFNDEKIFSNKFLNLMVKSLNRVDKKESERLRKFYNNINDLEELSDAITEFIEAGKKEVVLIIDEVDKSTNNQLFLSFLGMLRNKYLSRNIGDDYTFKSVILAGVYDIKNLKLKIRDNDENRLNSPWNIAVNFNIDMNFSNDEIKTMLEDYWKYNNIENPSIITELADKIYYYSNGYPFLVSRLCQIIDEELLLEKRPWIIDDVHKAVKILLKENNTLFDDLIKNLENNITLNEYIFDIVFNGAQKIFNIDNPLISQGSLYGILKEDKGIVKVNNRIFEQRIYNYFISKLENSTNNMSSYNYRENFLTSNGGLDIEKVLVKFKDFMREQYSNIDEKFIEREGRLLFLAFIKPIINGVGFDFKEVQIAQEKRLDIVITYSSFKYIIELKIWNGEKYHKAGLKQLSDYIGNQGLDTGYLLVFNFNKNKEFKEERNVIGGKDLFIVYV